MFGIGGGELIFILFIVLMLFGSDKVPEIARTMGKAMAQLKNATNDIKNEIQKGAEDNGFDHKMLSDLTHNITSEINSAKANLLGDTATTLTGISSTFTSEISKTKNDLLGETKVSTTEVTMEIDNTKDDLKSEKTPKAEQIEDPVGPIKRKK